MRYRFKSFELDTQRAQVSREGVSLALRPKCYDLLLYLVQRPRTLATKDELLTEVWPEVTVQESSLTQCIAQLRESLSTEGHALIRTVAKRGYILEADVERTESSASKGFGVRTIPAVAKPVALLVTGLAIGYVATFVAPLETPTRPHFWPGLVLETDETILGEPLPTLSGPLALRADLKFVPPGQVSPWHGHDEVVFAFVLSGEAIVEYSNGTSQVLRAGAATVEGLGELHQARNTSEEIFQVLVVSITEAETQINPLATRTSANQ